MVEVHIYLPESLARALGENSTQVGRRLLEDAAIEEYRAGRLSQRQIGEMLGLDYWQTESFLAKHGVPINYTAEDVVDDVATLDRILGNS